MAEIIVDWEAYLFLDLNVYAKRPFHNALSVLKYLGGYTLPTLNPSRYLLGPRLGPGCLGHRFPVGTHTPIW